ncbi:hypothetical protein NKL07_33050 [Mesorhizobium sp. C280B]|uniref:hypothetical protein n=1 Tax=unclassified Mesorhizobium TaxID=325217 RepID=UPI0003CF15D5|nr:hypothetical protein [Mesorhizobium sp. LSJC280B00]ESW64571.1 hypothetical protein X772_35850 [Mesorhizobium sp. LSJC280B00]
MGNYDAASSAVQKLDAVGSAMASALSTAATQIAEELFEMSQLSMNGNGPTRNC